MLILLSFFVALGLIPSKCFFLPFSCYEWYVRLWSDEHIKPSSNHPMVLDLQRTFTVESNELLVVYQINLSQWLWRDVFLTFCYLGLEFCRGHWWGEYQPVWFIIQGFSKQCENLHHQRVTIVCLSLSSASVDGVNKTGHHVWGGLFCYICCLSLVWSLPMCVYFPFDSWCVFILHSGKCLFVLKCYLLPILNQRKEQRESWDRTRSFTPIPLLSFSDPEIL